MMRDIVLDTYAGEGKLLTDAADWPGWKHIYFKVADGAWGYFDQASDPYKSVTWQILRESRKFETIGAYQYMRRHDYVHWLKQAECIMRQLDIMDNNNISADYFVLDIERRYNTEPNGKMPAKFGAWAYEIYRYLTDRGVFVMRYNGPYTEDEVFEWYGYQWHREVPWIVCQYPTYRFSVEKWERAVRGEIDPYLHHAKAKPVMWQVYDAFPAGDWMPDSTAADVNVWLTDWRELLGKPAIVPPEDTAIKRTYNRMKRIMPR